MTDAPLFGAMRAPRAIVFGAGQRRALGENAALLGKRVLVVTDARMAGDAAFIEMVATIAGETAIYDGVEAELPLGTITAGVDMGRALGAELVVGIGGGSCIDAAKLIALLLTHGGALSDYYGEFKVPGPILPVIAVPTTAGTGSEVTPVAVVGDPARAVKVGIASPYLIPEIALCDPELTLTCPKGLTAVSGADALVHAIEAFTTAPRAPDPGLTTAHVFIGKSVLTDQMAIGAITALGAHLERAVSDGSDATARAEVMLGATLAGLAFGTAGTSVCHAVQYPVGALTGTPHGLGVALMLPYALAFNRAHAGKDIATVGRLLGLARTETPQDEAIDACIAGVAALLSRIGIPKTLREIGIAENQLAAIGEQALGATRLVKNNPRPLDPAGMTSLLEAAFAGDLDALSTA